jgi:hypothetical protein
VGKPTKKDREREQKQKQYQRLKATLEDFHRKGPYYVQLLRRRGCTWPFFDYLQSYEEEFWKIAAEAKAHHASLVGVYEVDGPADFENSNLERFGCSQTWTHLVFDCDDPLAEGYGKTQAANVRACVSQFLTDEGELRTLIRIQKAVKGFPHSEPRYAVKIAALLHEIGHVEDLEKGINFDIANRTFNIIDGEVFANLFAIRECLRRYYRIPLENWLDALKKAALGCDYLGEVARRTLLAHDGTVVPNWQDLLGGATKEDYLALGFAGRSALGI